jgi:hypothetical protein
MHALAQINDKATSTRSQRLLSFLKHKKEWVKLNAAYVAATTTATTTSFAVSYVAERNGIERAHATTWISGISAFITGTSATCATWLFTHWDVYSKDPKLLLNDVKKLFGANLAAQSITWGASWCATLISVFLGAPNPVAITIQQVVDRLVFIPLYNYFNRNRVKEMEQSN